MGAPGPATAAPAPDSTLADRMTKPIKLAGAVFFKILLKNAPLDCARADDGDCLVEPATWSQMMVEWISNARRTTGEDSEAR